MNGVDVVPFPKPRKRVRLSHSAWSPLAKSVHLAYPGCGVCGRNSESTHHVVERGSGGCDVFENLVGLCGDGARGCHGAVTERRDGARERLRDYLELVRPDVIAYVLERKGAAWLNRHYPKRAA